MNMSDPVMAALIGASATLATALFQLLVNARRQADAKEVCQCFVHWNSQKARLARILVKYSL